MWLFGSVSAMRSNVLSGNQNAPKGRRAPTVAYLPRKPLSRFWTLEFNACVCDAQPSSGIRRPFDHL